MVSSDGETLPLIARRSADRPTPERLASSRCEMPASFISCSMIKAQAGLLMSSPQRHDAAGQMPAVCQIFGSELQNLRDADWIS